MVPPDLHARIAVLVVSAALGLVPLAASAKSGTPPCAPIMARLLPGEFHYCAAVRDWEAGRDQGGLDEARYAATWGEKRAQFDLGVYYFNGRHGAPTDHALGLAWLTLAAERKDPHYLATLESARTQATPDEQAKAQALLPRMIDEYGDVHAVDRAETRYRRELWTLRDELWRAVLTAAVDPWSKDTHVQIEGLGVVQPVEALTTLQNIGIDYFHDWGGNVVVGPLIPVNAPTPPGQHDSHAALHP